MTAQGRPGGTPRGTRQHPSAGPRTRSYSTWLKAAAHPRDRAGGPFATREMGLGSVGPARGHVGAEKVAAKWRRNLAREPSARGWPEGEGSASSMAEVGRAPAQSRWGALRHPGDGAGQRGTCTRARRCRESGRKVARIFTGARCRSGGEGRRAGAAENGRAPVRSHWEAVVHR